ncbi:MAG: hypothetical protein M0T77_05815 [Actinomycetota bacterium]|nr:hypothetical protein [Actinomycetota bacterium]
MMEVLRIALGILMVAPLGVLALYAVAFLAVVGWTLWQDARSKPIEQEFDVMIEQELDAFLAGLLGPGGAAATTGRQAGRAKAASGAGSRTRGAGR